MPKKPSTVLAMKAYPPLPSRRWVRAKLHDVWREGRELIRFEFSIRDDVTQAGRLILHELPAVLAPNSPLSVFLSKGFGVQLAQNETFDLATLGGREVELRFAKAQSDQEQAIAAIRRSDEPGPDLGSTKPADRESEVGRGLG